PYAACQWSLIVGGEASAAGRVCRPYTTRPRPRMRTIATAAGNTVPPWNRTLRPEPFCASLAAFLVDDELATTREAIGEGPDRPDTGPGGAARSAGAQPTQQPVVRCADGGRRGVGDHPPAAARTQRAGPLPIVEHAP